VFVKVIDELALRCRAVIDRNQRSEAESRQDGLPLTAGMQLSAEILQGRSVIEYLLSPVQQVFSEAATER
jgi:hypothetical protein